MKILIIPSWYPNDKDPLWGNYFIKQAEALNDYADVSMLYINRVGLKELKNLSKEKQTDGYYSDKYKFKFYKKSIINFKSVSLDYSYKLYAKKAYKAYKKLELINGRFDAILVESALPAGIAAKYISSKENIPYILHSHSKDIITNPYYKDYVIDIIKNAKDVMSVNEEIKNEIEKYRPCTLVPNFVDCKKFDVKLKQSKKDFNLINISNFYKVKAIDILLKAMDIVVNQKGYKNIKLNIIGTGEYKDYYESMRNSLKLNKNVNFLGYIDNNEIPSYLSKSNALCVSSTFETFCIPIVEALSTGIPVITTACTGPLEIVNKTNSLVVPINDYESYADAIIKMYDTYEKYDNEKIKKYAFNKYDKSIICNKIIDIIKKS